MQVWAKRLNCPFIFIEYVKPDSISFLLILYLLLSLCGCDDAPNKIRKKADKVVVFKAERKMWLMHNQQVIASYAIALGAEPEGHKKQEGDERTPEGNYTLDWRNAQSSCYKSLHISYPNEADKTNAQQLGVSPGGMVMIHGLHPSVAWLGSWHTVWDWTDGCVAVSNDEMDEIWQMVPDGTPMELKP